MLEFQLCFVLISSSLTFGHLFRDYYGSNMGDICLVGKNDLNYWTQHKKNVTLSIMIIDVSASIKG